MEPVNSFVNQVPTGDEPLDTFSYYVFKCPSALWFLSAILGQIVDLNQSGAWAFVGEFTPDEAAEAATQVYESIHRVFPIGLIVPYAGSLPPEPFILACDGADVFISDYPELYAEIGAAWGVAPIGSFKLPDLRGRTLIGSGQGPGLSNRVLADEEGEEDHQLTEPELASHQHAYRGAQITLTVEGELTTEPVAVINDTLTEAAGSDQPHNNMQPFAVVNYGIVAK